MDAGNASPVTALMPLKHYHPAYLQQAIESMFRQSDPRWRLLVIAEPDEVETFAALLCTYLGDPRIRLVTNEGRMLAGAVNTGMRRADTAFVALLFGDDMWASHAVGVLRRCITAHPEADFFHSARVVIDEHDRVISRVYPSTEHFTLEDFATSSPVKHLLCWRRTTALSFGGLDETLNSVGPDDFDFPWTMAERGARFVAIQDCLYLYRDHRESYRLTTHLPLSVHLREIRRILRKHGVSGAHAARTVAEARRSFLRQCLYRSWLHKRVADLLGRDPRLGWRERYPR